MVNRKNKNRFWHHRVPDFQLVYCGPEEHAPKKVTRLYAKEKVVNVSLVSDTPNRLSDKSLEKQKRRVRQ